ncbi:MAG: ribosome biogenesis GTPase Der [Leptospiraceae bacterium]|nr:ribosome biogenesis GTPase Der [Leptospiraceae bacterium]MCK6382243.1 ribosome biogenesis GTPase Der [Leptospiraceae bacterium]
MKRLPLVSIVGRQNVGKSTLFNSILKKNIAITYNFPGVTRDVLRFHVKKEDPKLEFILCDTPGLDIENTNDLTSSIIEISFKQLVESDLIIFVMDKNEITSYDHKLISLLKRDKRLHNKNIIYCINKSDSPEEDYDLDEFYRYGLSEVIPISALGRRNIKLLLEKLSFYLKDIKYSEDEKIDFRISFVGKPNSGKSSLLNAIVGESVSVVSDIPGTTRDPVNTIIQFNGQAIEILDTAGIRKSSKSAEKLEFYSYQRTLKTMESSDIVVHLIDAEKGVGEFDKKIFSYIRRAGKAMVLAINKWDLIPEKSNNTLKDYKDKMLSRFPALKDTPILSISAKTKQRIHKLLIECVRLHSKTTLKISTSKLNETIQKIFHSGKIEAMSKKKPRLYYSTQVSSSPFKLLFFVNDESLFQENLISYLRNQISKEFGLSGIFVEIELRVDKDKRRKEKK